MDNQHHATAQRLINDLTGRTEADEASFALAYRLGYMAGRDVGYKQAEHELHQAWATIAARIRDTANVPTHNALKARRTEHGGPAYENHLTRHGGEEYAGGPVDYDTGKPAQPTTQTVDDPWATDGAAA